MHHMNSPNYFSVICFLQALTAGAVASAAESLSNVRWGAEGADLPLVSSGTLQQLEEGCVLLFRYVIKTLQEKRLRKKKSVSVGSSRGTETIIEEKAWHQGNGQAWQSESRETTFHTHEAEGTGSGTRLPADPPHVVIDLLYKDPLF